MSDKKVAIKAARKAPVVRKKQAEPEGGKIGPRSSRMSGFLQAAGIQTKEGESLGDAMLQRKPNRLGFLGPGSLQAKLKIGQPGDKYEQEADAVADKVVSTPAHSFAGGAASAPNEGDGGGNSPAAQAQFQSQPAEIQEKCADCDAQMEAEEPAQTATEEAQPSLQLEAEEPAQTQLAPEEEASQPALQLAEEETQASEPEQPAMTDLGGGFGGMAQSAEEESQPSLQMEEEEAQAEIQQQAAPDLEMSAEAPELSMKSELDGNDSAPIDIAPPKIQASAEAAPPAPLPAPVAKTTKPEPKEDTSEEGEEILQESKEFTGSGDGEVKGEGFQAKVESPAVQQKGEESSSATSTSIGEPTVSAGPGLQQKNEAESETEEETEEVSETTKEFAGGEGTAEAGGPGLQTEAAEVQETPLMMQTDGAPVGTDNLSGQLDASKGGGNPLPNETRSEMESGIGADFSDVRVHTGSEAKEMSSGLGAKAFTHGNDIYFNEGNYDTGSSEGKHLLAHELTHTVQQGAAPVQSKEDPDVSLASEEESPVPAREEAGIQLKLEDHERPEHGDNSKDRLKGEVDDEVGLDDLRNSDPNDYEKPDPDEKAEGTREMSEPAAPDVNEAEIAKPQNEQLAEEGEDKVENPEELVEEKNEEEPDPNLEEPTTEIGKMEQAKTRSDELFARADAIRPPAPPQEVEIPEPIDPKDAEGEPLPFDSEGEMKVLEASQKIQQTRNKGQDLLIKAATITAKADNAEAKMETTRAAVAESQHNTTQIDEAYQARREAVEHNEEGLEVAKDKQETEKAELPQYQEEADEQKSESGGIAEESREQKRVNEANQPEEPEDREKSREQGSEIEKAAEATVNIDDAFGEAQKQAEHLGTKNEEAETKNSETETKIGEMNSLLDQGDAKVVELRGANEAANADIDSHAGEPEEIRVTAAQMEQRGQQMIQESEEKEAQLHESQAAYQRDLNAIPKFDLEKQLKEEDEKETPTSEILIQKSDDEMAQGDYADQINVFEGTFLDPNANQTLAEREQAAVKARERRAREVDSINDYLDKPFEDYTSWERIGAGLNAKWEGFTGWLDNLTFGDVIGGIGKMILDTINPLAYLKGITAGFTKVVNGVVNLFVSLWNLDFWGVIKGAADTATGVAIISGTITALAFTIAAIMTVAAFFGFVPAISVIVAMGNIMGWSGPIAFWSGLASLALNSILGIKSLVDMGTADSADQLAAETDDLQQDVQDGVTGGLMALVGHAGSTLGPTLAKEAAMIGIAAEIGGRGFVAQMLLMEGLVSTFNLLTLKGVRQWFGGQFDNLGEWLATRGAGLGDEAATVGDDMTRLGGETGTLGDDGARAADDFDNLGDDMPRLGDEAGQSADELAAAREVDELGPMNQETRDMLMDDADMRQVLADNQDLAHLFRRCASPCYPPNMSGEHFSRLRRYLDDMRAAGREIDEALINDYLYQNRSNLDYATSRFTNSDIPLANKIPSNFTQSTLDDLVAAFPEFADNPVIARLVDDGVSPTQLQDIIMRANGRGVSSDELTRLLDNVPAGQRDNVLGMLSLSDDAFDNMIGSLRTIDGEGAWGNFVTRLAELSDADIRWVHTPDGRVIEVNATNIPAGTQPGAVIDVNGESVMYLGNTDEVAQLTGTGGQMNGLINPRGGSHYGTQVESGGLVDAPSYNGGRPGHAMDEHGVTFDSCADVLNSPDRVFTGIYEQTGRPVDVYWQQSPTGGANQGRVVITVHGNKTQVITAYGERGFAFRGSPRYVDPARWVDTPTYVEL